jgi:Uma2 family endonuclease
MHMARKAQAFAWTLAELDRLPDDGNRYELVRGELFVTPAPSPAHEAIATVLADILGDYVRKERVGRVFRPRAVVQAHGSQAEPDIMVRPWTGIPPARWNLAPLPLLVVEIVSGITGRRDHGPKRGLYVEDLTIPTYWIVDGAARTIRLVRPGHDDVSTSDFLSWQPTGATAPLHLDVAAVFTEALGT